MRGKPAVHARVNRRLSNHPGQPGRRHAQHARPACSVLHVHGPSARPRGAERSRGATSGRRRARREAADQRRARTQTIGETQGFMKALVGTCHDRIVGFTMIGPEAGEVVSTVQTAMLAEVPYSTLGDAVLAHPTMAEGLGPLLSTVPPRAK